MRVCRAWLAYGCPHVLDVTCTCFLDARMGGLLRAVHVHAPVLHVRVLGITYACIFDARMGGCAWGGYTRMRVGCVCVLLDARMCLV
jgi:hypothetical protein